MVDELIRRHVRIRREVGLLGVFPYLCGFLLLFLVLDVSNVYLRIYIIGGVI